MPSKPSKKLRIPGEMQKHLETVTTLLKNESGRGAILVGVAYLEEVLAEVIAAHVRVHDWDKELFTMDGPVGTFSAKIKMAGALGMVTPEEAKTLDALREVRNSAAHFDRKFDAGFAVDFDNDRVIRRLEASPLYAKVIDGSRRTAFMLLIAELSVRLHFRITEAAKVTRPEAEGGYSTSVMLVAQELMNEAATVVHGFATNDPEAKLRLLNVFDRASGKMPLATGHERGRSKRQPR